MYRPAHPYWHFSFLHYLSFKLLLIIMLLDFMVARNDQNGCTVKLVFEFNQIKFSHQRAKILENTLEEDLKRAIDPKDHYFLFFGLVLLLFLTWCALTVILLCRGAWHSWTGALPLAWSTTTCAILASKIQRYFLILTLNIEPPPPK